MVNVKNPPKLTLNPCCTHGLKARQIPDLLYPQAVRVPDIAGAGGARKTTHQLVAAHIPKLLEKLADDEPLLLVLDEVQTLGRRLDSDKTNLLEDTLERIHNGKLAKPVVLACGGLGISSQVFARLGISRFKGRCLVNLGRLSEVNERAVIRDWLVKAGGAQEAGIQPWITAIAQETHGWPQHIAFYAQTAAKRLKARNGQVVQEDLEAVLKQGRGGKRVYYEKRLEYLNYSGAKVLATLLQRVSISDSLNLLQTTLVDKLVETGSMSQKDAERVFNYALNKGVLSNAGTETPFHYDIPIPSMKAYLLEIFGLERKSNGS